MVAVVTRPRGRRDGKVERRVVVGRADYVLASVSAGSSCVTRRRVARSGDGGCCDGVASGVLIFFFFLHFYHLYIVRSATPWSHFMLINDESCARILLKRKKGALHRSDEELAIPASNDALFLNQMHFLLGFFPLLQPIESITDVTDGEKKCMPLLRIGKMTVPLNYKAVIS